MDVFDRIEEALRYVDPNLPRDEWAEIGMAVKSAIPNGLCLFDDWSKGGQSYNYEDTLATWRSIKPNGGITIRTLFYLAKKNGWNKGREYHEDVKPQQVKQKIPIKCNSIGIQTQIEDTAKRSRKVWEEAIPASFEHAYLAKKQAEPVGIGEVSGDCVYLPKYIKSSGRFLVVPMHDINGNVWCIQFISETGKKSFIQGKQKPGVFFRIGNDGNRFTIVESAITGLSYHYATGETVYCAFSVGALKRVGVTLRSAYPYALINIVADDDWSKPVNTGVIKALEAASIINAKVYKSDFEGLDRKPEHTDFNDLCVLRGQNGSY